MSPKLFLAVPCFAQQLYCWTAESITNTAIALEKKGWLRQIHYFASSNIVVSRNSLVDIFVKSDCNCLLFADADGSWPVEAVFAMLAASKPIVSLCFAKKEFDWQRATEAARSGMSVQDLPAAGAVPLVHGDTSQVLKGGLIDLPFVGMGLTLIKREVFEKMKPFCTKYKRADNGEWSWGWFDHAVDPDSSRMLSEDHAFCRRAREAGQKCYALASYQTAHTGPWTFVWDQAIQRRVHDASARSLK